MNKFNLLCLQLVVLIAICFPSCNVAQHHGDSEPVTHEQWTELLQKHVSEAGWVDYEGFREDEKEFQAYLNVLRLHHPNDSWTEDEQLAYWINAYNAFTVELIVKHYPVERIKDIKRGIPFINTVWDIKFIEIEGEKYDLNNLEHGIMRKEFDEPRIHFAINCASVSCPKLANRAFESKTLDAQLEEAARAFINDESRNEITSPDKAELSRIFSWFKGDFTDDQSLIEFINLYSNTKLSPDADVDFLDYDWGINDQASN